MSEWIIIPNWEKYHPRADRSLPWFKVYYHLTRRDDFRSLSLAARGLLVSLWCEYGPSKGLIRTSDIPGRVAQKVPRKTLDSLVQAGFIVLSATQPNELLGALEEKRRDKTPQPPAERGAKTKSRKPKTTGWRLVRGSHGMTHIPDPEGTDKPPVELRPL